MTRALARWIEFEDRKDGIQQQARGRCHYCDAPGCTYHHAFTPERPLRFCCERCNSLQHAWHEAIQEAKANEINKGE